MSILSDKDRLFYVQQKPIQHWSDGDYVTVLLQAQDHHTAKEIFDAFDYHHDEISGDVLLSTKEYQELKGRFGL